MQIPQQTMLLAAVCAFLALVPTAHGLIEGPSNSYGFPLPGPLYNYWNYTTDIKDINALTRQGKFDDATAIYYQGKNNRRNSTNLRIMADFSIRNLTGEGPTSWFGVYSNFYSMTYLKDLIEPALKGTGDFAGACCGVRDAALNVYWRLWQAAYAQHEVDGGAAEGAADEAGHGFAVLASPVDRPHNFWVWVEQTSKAACINKIEDPVTALYYAPSNIAYRTDISEMGPAISEEDLDLRGQRVQAVREKLERQLTVDFMQSLMVHARRGRTGVPKTATDCNKSCWAAANKAGAAAAWNSIAPLVAKGAQSQKAAIDAVTALLKDPTATPKAVFAGLKMNLAAIATAMGIDFAKEVFACAV